jgi:hypothetical protein
MKRKAMPRPLSLLGALLLALVLGGCESKPSPMEMLQRGPVYTPRNTVGVSHIPRSIQRVVLLPIHSEGDVSQETLRDLDPIFGAALEHQVRFEVVFLSREECQRTFGAPDFSSTDALPHDFLAILGDKLSADAVLFVDLTAYRAYRPLSLGIRSKLASVKERSLVWAFDELISASDPTVVNSVRRFYLRSDRGPVPFDLTTAALESPNRFAAFAADAVFKTLPPR